MLIALLAAVCAVAACGYWVARGQPRPVAEGASDRVQCMSYAPFRKPGETPFIEDTMVSEARLREDLTILSARTGCVRTYSVQQGLDAVPRVARELGMKVMLGVWLGRDRVKNELELVKGIQLANEYADTVSALVVGNEVLLRRELPESVLAGYLDLARKQVKVPVTYADVWEFWMEHRELAEHVSFVTIHVLPYWEDEPLSIEVAIEHIVETAEQMRSEFGGKDILIGETGWPSNGRSRREAVASRINQARFFRQFSLAAAEHNLRYNFIEAFDQPWKRRMEGAMGGQWGLFNSDGVAKFPATGPVEEDPHARRGLVAAAAGLLLFLVVGTRQRLRGWQLVAAAAAGATSGAVLAAQWQHMLVWNRYFSEWAATAVYTVLALAFVAFALRAIRARLGGGLQSTAAALPLQEASFSAATIPPFREVLAGWRTGQGRGEPSLRWLSLLRIVFLFGAAAMSLLLVFDARYRGFPVMLYALPLMSLVLLLAAGFRTSVFDVEEGVLATIVLVCALAFIPMERVSNLQALTFGLQMIVFAGAATGFRYWRFEPQAGRLEAADRAGA